MIRLFRFLILGSLSLGLFACASSSKDPAVVYQNQTASQIFQKAEASLAKKNYGESVQALEALDALYPFNPYDEQAQLDLIYAYYKNEDMASAAATAEKFLRLYPRSQHADYAYYFKGLADFYSNLGWAQRYFPLDLSQRDPTDALQAFHDFQQLVTFYPNSPYAPDARQRMIYLRDLLATHELYIAQYYLQRKAYVAAANRASYLLQHYNGTPQTQNALNILVESYHALGLTTQENQARELLNLNYSASAKSNL